MLQSKESQRVRHDWATTTAHNTYKNLTKHTSALMVLFINVFSIILKFFLMWTIFKVFIEFVTILFLFYVLVFWPGGK